MATRQPTLNRQVSPDNSVIVITWSGLTFASTDDGAPISYPAWGEKTFQVSGALGAAGAVTLEGSNDGLTWATLNDKQGVAMVVTALGIKSTQDGPAYIRPRITAGDGATTLVVSVAIRRDGLPENQP